MTEHGVVIQIDLGIDGVPLAFGSENPGVDFGQTGVRSHESGVKLLHGGCQLAGLLDIVGDQAHAHIHGFVIKQTVTGIDGELEDELWSILGHLFDFNATFGAGHEQHALAVAVDQHADVVLAGDIHRRRDQHRAHGVPLDVHAQDILGIGFHIFNGRTEFDATSLAAATGKHLGLHHHGQTVLFGTGHSIGNGLNRCPAGHWQAKASKNLLSLIFVDIHAFPPRKLTIVSAGRSP